MFGPLDYIYMPAPDFDAVLSHYTDVLGAKLLWKIRDMDTVVAALRLAEPAPTLLLASHLEGEVPILIFRVDDLKSTVAGLKRAGLSGVRVELPPGPCFRFDAPGGQRFAVYQRVRPQVERSFLGRIDP